MSKDLSKYTELDVVHCHSKSTLSSERNVFCVLYVYFCFVVATVPIAASGSSRRSGSGGTATAASTAAAATVSTPATISCSTSLYTSAVRD